MTTPTSPPKTSSNNKSSNSYLSPHDRHLCQAPNSPREQMQKGMESCPVKTVISGGAGFALGGVFGLFMASVRLHPLFPPAFPY